MYFVLSEFFPVKPCLNKEPGLRMPVYQHILSLFLFIYYFIYYLLLGPFIYIQKPDYSEASVNLFKLCSNTKNILSLKPLLSIQQINPLTPQMPKVAASVI